MQAFRANSVLFLLFAFQMLDFAHPSDDDLKSSIICTMPSAVFQVQDPITYFRDRHRMDVGDWYIAAVRLLGRDIIQELADRFENMTQLAGESATATMTNVTIKEETKQWLFERWSDFHLLVTITKNATFQLNRDISEHNEDLIAHRGMLHHQIQLAEKNELNISGEFDLWKVKYNDNEQQYQKWKQRYEEKRSLMSDQAIKLQDTMKGCTSSGFLRFFTAYVGGPVGFIYDYTCWQPFLTTVNNLAGSMFVAKQEFESTANGVFRQLHQKAELSNLDKVFEYRRSINQKLIDDLKLHAHRLTVNLVQETKQLTNVRDILDHVSNLGPYAQTIEEKLPCALATGKLSRAIENLADGIKKSQFDVLHKQVLTDSIDIISKNLEKAMKMIKMLEGDDKDGKACS